MLVAHDRGDDAGRGRGEERLDIFAVVRRQGGAKLRAFLFDQTGIGVCDGADRLRHADAHRDCVLAGHACLKVALELRIVFDVGRRRAVAGAAQTCEAVAQIEHEALAALLAIVDDVDAGFDLLRDDGVDGGAAARFKRGCVEGFAARALHVKLGQGGGPRQAAGMRGQDAILTELHCRPHRQGGVRTGAMRARTTSAADAATRGSGAADLVQQSLDLARHRRDIGHAGTQPPSVASSPTGVCTFCSTSPPPRYMWTPHGRQGCSSCAPPA